MQSKSAQFLCRKKKILDMKYHTFYLKNPKSTITFKKTGWELHFEVFITDHPLPSTFLLVVVPLKKSY